MVADRLISMPPTRPDPGLPRPVDVVQADIRALMQQTGGWLWGPTRKRYEALRDEWVAAERARLVEAA